VKEFYSRRQNEYAQKLLSNAGSTVAFVEKLGRWWPGFTSDMMRPLIVKNDVEK